MKTPEEKAESMYGASKRLHDEMDRADKHLLGIIILIVAFIIVVLGVGVWGFWRYIL